MPDDALRDEIERLRERAARERRAREHAEAVAEQGTRLLYERQRQLQLLHVIADAANDAISADAVLQVALDEICAYTTWPVGHAYLVSDDATYPLAPTRLWHLDQAEQFAAFRHVTEHTRFRRGEGLPGRVLDSGMAVWMVDVTRDETFTRARQAAAIEVRAGFGIPVLVGDSVIAVLEFFSREPADPDQRLMEVTTQVGLQVGRAFERQRAKDALLAINARLHEEVAEREAAQAGLQRARDEAERANQAKSDFLSRMSHDLRTPLNAILGFAQLLEIDRLSAEQHDSVRQILKGGAQLLDLINEVLDLTRIEAGHLALSPEPVNVAEIAQYAIALIRPLAAQRGITVDDVRATGCAHRYVLADRQRLNQILMNLLSNAVKYNRDGGRVQVTCVEVPGGRIHIKVTDTGAGIAPELLALLFQPFERLGAGQTAVEGTGLGLALSKALAEAMDGTLGLTSVVDQGTTFWVELGLVEAAAAVTPAEVKPAAAGPDPRVTGTVLYIEDNLPNRRLMERLLARRPGVRLIAAVDGQSGLDKARADAPHLILLDLNLPDMLGDEVLRRLREEECTRTIPVVILSADASPAQIRRLLAAGASAYLTKPIVISEVLRVLDETLEHRSNRSDCA